MEMLSPPVHNGAKKVFRFLLFLPSELLRIIFSLRIKDYFKLLFFWPLLIWLTYKATDQYTPVISIINWYDKLFNATVSAIYTDWSTQGPAFFQKRHKECLAKYADSNFAVGICQSYIWDK